MGIEAELKLGIRQEDSNFCGVFAGGTVQGEAPVPGLEKKILSQLFFRLGIGHGKIVARLGLCGGSKEGLGKRIGLAEAAGQRSAPSGTFLPVLLPSAARQVTANDTLHRQGLGGDAAGQPTCVFFGGRNPEWHVEPENVVGMGGGEGFEPEFGDGGQEDSLAGDGVGEDDIKSGNTVGGHKPDFVPPAVDIADFSRSEQDGGISHLPRQ